MNRLTAHELQRHSVLIAAGWTYSAVTDMYAPPGGGEKRFNLAAAWDEHARSVAETATKIADPRRSRPA